jgi:hypothetical protein
MGFAKHSGLLLRMKLKVGDVRRKLEDSKRMNRERLEEEAGEAAATLAQVSTPPVRGRRRFSSVRHIILWLHLPL